MADKWTAAFNKIPAQLAAMGAGSVPGTAGAIDLTDVKVLIVGTRDAPEGGDGPILWVYLDSPVITESYVASSRLVEGCLHLIVELSMDASLEEADLMVPYGDATRKGILRLLASICDAMAATSWSGIVGFVSFKQTIDAVGAIGDNLYKAIVKVELKLRYADSSRRA
jgi:hypothetical protein